MTIDYPAIARALRPECALALGALVVLTVDLSALRSAGRERRLRASAGIGAIAAVVAFVLSLYSGSNDAMGGLIMTDALGRAARAGVALLVLTTLGICVAGAAPRHPAEFVSMVLFAATGMSLMTVARQLLVVFLALELTSLALYVLVGFDRGRAESAEAALKYFLFGGLSAAFLLFGFSLIYGLTGSIEPDGIAKALAGEPLSPMLAAALVMVLVGFGFKSAAAPFHFWAPDAYQGAPPAAAALVASASKLAGAVLFTRLLWGGLGGAAGSLAWGIRPAGWLTVVGVMCAASILLGNLAALAQRNLRRLLAYSAIGHAGVLLLAVMMAEKSGPGPLLYHAFTYGLATAGCFGVIAVLDRAGGCQNLEDLDGLWKRSPLLAACLGVFVLSLAGIPPLAGFFGKFYIFAVAFRDAGVGSLPGVLACAAILLSAVALYYYLIVLKAAVVRPASRPSPPVALPWAGALALVLAAGLVVAFGLQPGLILDWLR